MTNNKKWVECGHVVRSLGLGGELVVDWHSGECPVQVGDEVLVALRNKSDRVAYSIAALRKQGRFFVAHFKNVADRDAADTFKGAKLFISQDGLKKLSAGEYYTYQIIGLDVFTEDGKFLGQIQKIFTAGGSDVYEVVNLKEKGSKEILIPAISDIIISIDLNLGRVIVRLIQGMTDAF